MLKNISSVISPDLLWLLASMGHGDDLVLVDRNFPSPEWRGVLCRPAEPLARETQAFQEWVARARASRELLSPHGWQATTSPTT